MSDPNTPAGGHPWIPLVDPIGLASRFVLLQRDFDPKFARLDQAIAVVGVRELTQLACPPNTRKREANFSTPTSGRISKFVHDRGQTYFGPRALDAITSPPATRSLPIGCKRDVFAPLAGSHFVVLVREDTVEGGRLLAGEVDLRDPTPAGGVPSDLIGRVQMENTLTVISVATWLAGWPA